MKKLTALLLSVVMIFSLCATASAEKLQQIINTLGENATVYE